MKRLGLVALALGALAFGYFAGAHHAGLTNAEAQAPHGFGKKLYVIMASAVGDGSAQQRYIDAHLMHQADLEKQGVMFGAGPATLVNGSERLGLIIIRANSQEEAKKIADSDPMHINKARTYKLYEWSLNEGAIGVRVNLAEGKITLD